MGLGGRGLEFGAQSGGGRASEFVLKEEGLGSELGLKEAGEAGIWTLAFEDLER